MKRLLAAAAILVAAVSHAEDFRSKAEIKLQGSDPFQRIQLPFEAYRDTRRDLGDLRVLNAKGEAVPHAFAGESAPEREPPKTVRLPQFAVVAPPASVGTTASGGPVDVRVDVRVRTLPNGTLVSVEQRPSRGLTPDKVPPPNAYYLDASQLKFPIATLTFDWEVSPGAEVVKVSVQASDDLRDWRSVANRVPLMRLEQAGVVLSQTQIPLRGTTAKYFRISWDGAPFILKAVDAESAPTTRPAEQEQRRVTAATATRTKEGDLVFDLGARLPVEAIRVVFPEINSVVPFEVSIRDTKEGAWRTVVASTFYRISRGGEELASRALEIGVQGAREWRLRPQVKGAGDGAMPTLEVQWRPAEVVFIAKGDPPFTLAFGDKEARAAALPVSSLMPGYERGAEKKLALSTLGEVRTSAGPAAPMEIFGDTSPRKVGLWAVLIIGVLVLGFMAWKLMGQMKGSDP